MSNVEVEAPVRGRRPSFLARHPIAVLLVVSIALVWAMQVASLLAGVDVMPAKFGELLVLLAAATWITSRVQGRGAVRRLYAGLTRWRLGWWYPVLLAAVPVLTIAVALATGTLHTPSAGWTAVLGTYLLFLVLILLTASLWEETVWAGFVQTRLMAARGLLIGSVLTAVPFFLIHLPLAFEADGWKGTTWHDAFIDWGLLLLAAPFLRYLIGMLLVDTGGSTLAAGLLHASFNASGAMVLIPGGWQNIPALLVLTLLVAGHRALRRRRSSRSLVVPEPRSTAVAPLHETGARGGVGQR